jgi:hypothetical protein
VVVWLVHYFLFFLMSRQLFIHHYLLSHLASALVAQASTRILLFVPSMALQSSESQSQSPDILLSVSCARLDFQVSAMAQICSGLSGTGTVSGAGLVHANLVLPAEEPMLGFHQSELSARTCASASSPIAIRSPTSGPHLTRNFWLFVRYRQGT